MIDEESEKEIAGRQRGQPFSFVIAVVKLLSLGEIGYILKIYLEQNYMVCKYY
jgi:hypothetical protein